MGVLTRCRDCKARITFFRSPYTGKVRAFDATPVQPRTFQAVNAFPVMSGQAYKFAELVAILQPLREYSAADAEAEVYDMPWHTVHTCSPLTDSAPVERTTP